MGRRWRACSERLAITLILLTTVAASGPGDRPRANAPDAPDAPAASTPSRASTASTGSIPPTAWLAVRGPDDVLIARAPLSEGATVALRYRNSLYRSIAEERFAVERGELVLVSLAAQELAVLEEYYRIAGPARRDDGRGELGWSARPEQMVRLQELRVAATDLGRRTLIVPGLPPVELWRVVDDRRPTVTLTVEPPDR
jgi:hypothetical protein